MQCCHLVMMSKTIKPTTLRFKFLASVIGTSVPKGERSRNEMNDHSLTVDLILNMREILVLKCLMNYFYMLSVSGGRSSN